jgi:hypothetical protein
MTPIADMIEKMSAEGVPMASLCSPYALPNLPCSTESPVEFRWTQQRKNDALMTASARPKSGIPVESPVEFHRNSQTLLLLLNQLRI